MRQRTITESIRISDICEWLGQVIFIGAAVAAAAPAQAQSAEFSTLYSFTGGADGAYPTSTSANLIQAADGNLYGTTTAANPSNSGGTLYRLTPSGTFTTVHSFPEWSTNNAPTPPGSGTPWVILQGRDGSLYGTLLNGGIGYGSVFKYAKDGTVTTLYAFGASDGVELPRGLIQASDDNFYGTAANGPSGPVIYQVTPAGAFAVIYAFKSDCECALSLSGDGLLVETDPLTFAGSTMSNEQSNIYQVTASGTMSVLTSLSENWNFGVPSLAADGSIYVTATNGVVLGDIYHKKSDAPWTSDYTFIGAGDGAIPFGQLVRANDGTLYGVTARGGQKNDTNCQETCGVIYSFSPSGAYTIVYSFTGGDDGTGASSLLLGTDGALYGTTNVGGAHGLGSVFRITITAAQPPATGGGDTASGGGGSLDYLLLAGLGTLALSLASRRRSPFRATSGAKRRVRREAPNNTSRGARKIRHFRFFMRI